MAPFSTRKRVDRDGDARLAGKLRGRALLPRVSLEPARLKSSTALYIKDPAPPPSIARVSEFQWRRSAPGKGLTGTVMRGLRGRALPCKFLVFPLSVTFFVLN